MLCYRFLYEMPKSNWFPISFHCLFYLFLFFYVLWLFFIKRNCVVRSNIDSFMKSVFKSARSIKLLGVNYQFVLVSIKLMIPAINHNSKLWDSYKLKIQNSTLVYINRFRDSLNPNYSLKWTIYCQYYGDYSFTSLQTCSACIISYFYSIAI